MSIYGFCKSVCVGLKRLDTKLTEGSEMHGRYNISDAKIRPSGRFLLVADERRKLGTPTRRKAGEFV